MLTAKQNMHEVVFNGKPDRYVNQYEAMQLLISPAMMLGASAKKGEGQAVNAWGVTYEWPEGTPGGFPVHTPEKIVVKDIEHWADYVKAPSLDVPDQLWEICQGMYAAVDGNKAYKACMIAPGMFEQSHHLCSIDLALEYYMTNPDEMHDLIKYIFDWEMELAIKICDKLHPDMIFHHDDWGSEQNSFMRPSMFEDFFLEPYKQVYGYYHDHGVEMVVHHSDSYAANLVPDMIEMGINVFQGCMRSNNVAELVKQYGDKITVMGDIDNKQVDFTGWTVDDCVKAARLTLDANPLNGYIPCITEGGPGSVYPGTYMELIHAIDNYNCEKFGWTVEEIEAQRAPLQVMF